MTRDFRARWFNCFDFVDCRKANAAKELDFIHDSKHFSVRFVLTDERKEVKHNWRDGGVSATFKFNLTLARHCQMRVVVVVAPNAKVLIPIYFYDFVFYFCRFVCLGVFIFMIANAWYSLVGVVIIVVVTCTHYMISSCNAREWNDNDNVNIVCKRIAYVIRLRIRARRRRSRLNACRF